VSNFKATPEQWKQIEEWSGEHSAPACILELRARVAKLEAQANHSPGATKMVPPPVATDDELRAIWDRAYDLRQALRALYNLGVEHGRASSREVAEPAPVAGELVERVSRLIADFVSRSKPGDDCKPAAVKIVFQVAGWLQGQDWKCEVEDAVDLLEREAGR